jgi:hypothetical protein
VLTDILPDILAGPILRRLTPQQLVLWWVSPSECSGEFHCYLAPDSSVTSSSVKHSSVKNSSLVKNSPNEALAIFTAPLNEDNLTTFRVGKKAVVHLLDVSINLPVETYIEYDLLLIDGINSSSSLSSRKRLADIIPHLAYGDKSRPSFIIQEKINNKYQTD